MRLSFPTPTIDMKWASNIGKLLFNQVKSHVKFLLNQPNRSQLLILTVLDGVGISPDGNDFLPRVYVIHCVVIPFILDVRRWTYQPGSHSRKVTQDFSSTFLLRCSP